MKLTNTHVFVLEGPDGCGKSAVLKQLPSLLADHLYQSGIEVEVEALQDPGGTPLSSMFREIIMNGYVIPGQDNDIPVFRPNNGALELQQAPVVELPGPWTTFMLFRAARACTEEYIIQKDKEAAERNIQRIVFLDRWAMSTLVYQGYQAGLLKTAPDLFLPENMQLFNPVYFLLSVSAEVLLERIKAKTNGNKFDATTLTNIKQLNDWYMQAGDKFDTYLIDTTETSVEETLDSLFNLILDNFNIE